MINCKLDFSVPISPPDWIRICRSEIKSEGDRTNFTDNPDTYQINALQKYNIRWIVVHGASGCKIGSLGQYAYCTSIHSWTSLWSRMKTDVHN
jgi:hypothetical protein